MTGGGRLLDVRGLTVAFHTPNGTVRAADSVSFHLDEGEILGLAGESGAGKSVTACSLMGLLPPGCQVEGGTIFFAGRALLSFTERDWRGFRGSEAAMIFQNPMAALNPVYTVEAQLTEALRVHNRGVTRKAARRRAAEMLETAGMSDVPRVMRQYPYELSGGMCQRVMIAMALMCAPRLLIADEPTTALDVTTQHQITNLLREIRDKTGMAILFITHNLGVINRLCDRVCVMRAGKIIEHGPVERVLASPAHSYTQELLDSIPGGDGFLRERERAK